MKIFAQHITQCIALLLLSCMMMLTINVMGQDQAGSLEEDLDRLLKESEENWHKNIPKAKEAAKEAFSKISPDTKPALLAEAYAQYGISFYTELEYDSAIYYYKKATKIAAENNLEVYRYLAITTSAMEKTGRFMDVIRLIDQEISEIESKDEKYLNLLMMKLSASISIGLTEKSDSILTIADRLLESINSKNANEKLIKLKARYLTLTANYEKSDSLFQHLLELYIDADNQMDRATIYLLMAQNAMEISQYNRSSELLMKSQSIYDNLGYEIGQANIDLYTGTLLSWMGQYNDASDYIFQSLEIFEKSKNTNQMMVAYYELGWIFYSMKMEQRAKKYLDQSLTIARKISNIKYLGNLHNAYGSLYTDLEKYDSALFHFDSAIHYQNITKNVLSLSAAKFNKAVVLEKIGKKQEALELYRYSYKIDEKISNTTGLIEGDWVLGHYFLKNEDLDSAQYYFNLGENRAIALGEKYFLSKIYQAQADLAAKRSKNNLEAQYLRKALQTQKELSAENKTLELATIEATYDLKNKEKELALLNLQKENNEQTIALNQKTIDSQRNTLIALTIGVLLLLILSYIIFRFLKIRTKTNHQLRELYNEIQEKQEEIMAQSEELKEANDQVHELNEFLEKRVKERTTALEAALSELDHFFYRASHDFRGPLTTLLGLVGISKAYDLPEEAKNLFNKVNLTVKKLDAMVKKLQAVSFLGDFENLKSPQAIELKDNIQQIADEVIKSKSFDGIEYDCSININVSTKSVVFYPVVLDICLRNLIENSLAFNYSDKIEIEINAAVTEKQLILNVQDNGIGISDDMQEEIFSMFKRTSQISTGNGLGLYIVKKAIDQLGGQIQLKSNTRKGSIFILSFPLNGIEKEKGKLYNAQ